MKHIKLYEEFVNEQVDLKKLAKQVTDETEEGYKAKVLNGEEVVVMKGPVPNPDSNVKSIVWGWNPNDGAWTEGKYGVSYYTGDCKTIEDFIELLDNPEETNDMWD